MSSSTVPQPQRPSTKEKIIISTGNNKCPITQSIVFQLHRKNFTCPPTHTHLLHMDSKQKYLLSIQGLGSPGDQTRQEEPGYRAQLYGRSTREMRLSLESSAKSCKMRQEKGYIHNLRRYF